MEGLSRRCWTITSTKPFHPSELQLRIHNLFERQRKLPGPQSGRELVPPQNGELKKHELPQEVFSSRVYMVCSMSTWTMPCLVWEQLADSIHLSRSSLHRKLKALSGMSTTELVRNYRLQKATALLREGYNSSDAAYKTGFGSPAYFTKSFREVYGMTPGDYIRKQKA